MVALMSCRLCSNVWAEHYISQWRDGSEKSQTYSYIFPVSEGKNIRKKLASFKPLRYERIVLASSQSTSRLTFHIHIL